MKVKPHKTLNYRCQAIEESANDNDRLGLKIEILFSQFGIKRPEMRTKITMY